MFVVLFPVRVLALAGRVSRERFSLGGVSCAGSSVAWPRQSVVHGVPAALPFVFYCVVPCPVVPPVPRDRLPGAEGARGRARLACVSPLCECACVPSGVLRMSQPEWGAAAAGLSWPCWLRDGWALGNNRRGAGVRAWRLGGYTTVSAIVYGALCAIHKMLEHSALTARGIHTAALLSWVLILDTC